MALARPKLTLEEFLQLPEEEPALEYIDGEVTQKTAAMGQHGVLQLELGHHILRAANRGKRAIVATEVRGTYAGSSRVPDIAVYRWDRFPRDERGRVANRVMDPPDIAIEIVSPGQSVAGLTRRCLQFVEDGVGLALIVDPDDDSVLTFRAGEPTLVWRDADRIDFSPLLPDFNLTVKRLFATLSR